MNSKIIVALDFSNKEEVFDFVKKVSPEKCKLKVGKELFVKFGPSMVEELVSSGFEIFLDLKFHDIPTTVGSACRNASDLGVWMINIHASGGREMILAAKEGVELGRTRPLLVAVTVLTSLDAADLRYVGVHNEPKQQVGLLSKLAFECGLDGVVCSAREVEEIKMQTSGKFLCVTPGIRLGEEESKQDQKRVVTPIEAIKVGANYLVIGRSITRSENPIDILDSINDELNKLV